MPKFALRRMLALTILVSPFTVFAFPSGMVTATPTTTCTPGFGCNVTEETCNYATPITFVCARASARTGHYADYWCEQGLGDGQAEEKNSPSDECWMMQQDGDGRSHVGASGGAETTGHGYGQSCTWAAVSVGACNVPSFTVWHFHSPAIQNCFQVTTIAYTDVPPNTVTTVVIGRCVD